MATTSGIAGRIARTFINSKLTPLLMAAFLGIGLYSAWVTPKEEDPQIEVPMMDIAVQYPGATPQEVKSRVAEPIERLASNIDGVEYVYSTAMPGRAMVSVRYYVGEDPSTSTVKLYEELLKNMDEMPPGASRPLIKSREVDDVPILTLTLHSETTGDYELRRIGEEMAADLKTTDGVAEVNVHGGRPRQVRVALQPNQLAAHGLDPPSVAEQLRAANQETDAGAFQRMDESYLVETGGFLTSVDDVKTLVVGMHQGSPVYLKQVAEVTDGPAEPKNYVSFSYGAGTPRPDSLAPGGTRSAVTVAVAKRNGRDAMTIAEHSLDKLATLEQTLVPEGVTVSTTRNYGETASEKTNELMLHLLAAILAVTFVVSLAMGWRGGLVVFLSVPISFALTLFVYYFFGYTLNRITLFALIFVTGIVVDDSIIVAENIERHFKMGRLPKLQSALAAVDEVGNPTILATLTVIAAVLPMAFVSGLMGPYMSPMPIGASVAMTFSLVVALVIAPYLAFRLIPSHEDLTGEEGGGDDDENEENDSEYELEETAVYRAYAATIEPLLDSAWKRWAFLGGTTLLLLGSVSLFYFRAVTVKMLPFDDKNEFQVVVDMPEGTPLERTNAVLREMAADLTDRPVVTDVQTYAGDAAPVNLNGLVRHYDLRSAPHQGDLQVNLRAAEHRTRQSHAIAKDLRGPLQKIGEKYDAAVKVAEVPPGPPVRATLVAEIYGPDRATQRALADSVRQAFEATEGVVDVDWGVEADQTKYTFTVDKEKAMRVGVPTARVTQTMKMALDGREVTTLHDPDERDPVGVQLRLGEERRASLADLQNVPVQSPAGPTVPMADLVEVEKTTRDKHISRKNQRRVIYVTGNVAGAIESPVYAMLDMQERLDAIEAPPGYSFDQLYTGPPEARSNYALKWDGEWRVTYKVFRDLGIAFAIVLLLIYILIVGWFQDLTVPLVMMIAIPLSLIGIVLGHWLLGAFFTATSMIGFIALAGIMVRNGVLLIDFVNISLDQGASLRQAVIEAGAVRTRPILLTAGTVVIGATVILFDPIFQGLAISLIGGAIASTALTLLIVPLVYYMIESRIMSHES
ncbi:multidrug efflux pump subunit AcrB [Salinibacter ruber]|uniref:efflux RND transporter permease subunit n=1 Tax=Salinibacter ruber TaxID=146919 RepID=UPI00216729FE|nr:efflux RND transporter permease subunit [Salinibacter ruber]MCS3628184.1 multidrug efflux pump subunit AcrB [Salinibacter ruber]MCS3824639.1 multidrug efflux pump subunit AcrB [Salinibacter ruber]MCS4145093.1 multidrug efflux pump subunit AcrB [Salinibacter ruber]